MRTLSLVCIVGLVLATSGVAGAVGLQAGPLIFKTFNFEVGTSYTGGQPGVTYYCDVNTPGYDPGDPTKGLFSDLTINRGSSLMEGEDSWGLLTVTQLYGGVLNNPAQVPGSTFSPDLTPYWNAGQNNKYLVGVFYGGQDQQVTFDPQTGAQTILATGLEYNLYERTGAPANVATLDPDDRTLAAFFPAWNDNPADILQAAGGSDYFRFTGDAAGVVPKGATNVYLDVTSGAWNDLIGAWWYDVDPNGSDIEQDWNIPGTLVGERWVLSQDTGNAFIIPEPVTMLGVLLSLGGLGRYIRNRRSVA